jgi:hypothetical protein
MRYVQMLLGSALIGLGALAGLAFYDRYWRWRGCFNELGRCFDPVSQDVYLEQAGGVYGGLALLSTVLGMGLLLGTRNATRADQ